MANNFEMTFGATAFIPDSSSGPAQLGQVPSGGGRPCLAFDSANVEGAISFWRRVPGSYTGSGTLKAKLAYAMASATSGKVDWDVYVECVTPGDSIDTSTNSFDSANSGDDTVPGTAKYPDEVTITLTNKDSMAAGDWVRIKVERDADDGTNDTASGDAYFFGLTLYEEA